MGLAARIRSIKNTRHYKIYIIPIGELKMYTIHSARSTSTDDAMQSIISSVQTQRITLRSVTSMAWIPKVEKSVLLKINRVL